MKNKMKRIKAEKCSNGWLVIITDQVLASCESDVIKIIRENGLKIRKELSHKSDKENPNEWLYAD